MVSIFLVVAGLASLLVGIISGEQVLVYVAILLSLAGLTVTAVEWWKGRIRQHGAGSGEDTETSVAEDTEVPVANDVPGLDAVPADSLGEHVVSAAHTQGSAAATEVSVREDEEKTPVVLGGGVEMVEVNSTTAASKQRNGVVGPRDQNSAEPAESDLVLVVPGRRRYHRKDCSLIVGQATEEVVIAEAADEGFSACTKCHRYGPERS